MTVVIFTRIFYLPAMKYAVLPIDFRTHEKKLMKNTNMVEKDYKRLCRVRIHVEK
jgi:hypothetical protein